MKMKITSPKSFAKQLEKDLKKSVEKDLEKQPEKVLDSHIGEEVSEVCNNCGQPKMVIIKGGKVRCSECGYTADVSFNFSWK